MGKKDIISILVLLLSHISSTAQHSTIKEGVYRNIVEFHRNLPFYSLEEVDIDEDIGRIRNKYYVLKNKSGKKIRRLEKKIWAVYKDSCFYINYSRIGIVGAGFIKVEEFGRYSLIKGMYALTVSQRDRLIKNSFDFGLIGGGITSINVYKENSDYYHFLNLKTGVPSSITVEYVKFILKDDPILLKGYQSESEKESIETILKYIRQLNRRIPIY